VVYVSSYCDGSKLWKYALSDLSYIGTTSLSQNISNINGVTYKSGYFYISDSAVVWKVSSGGVVNPNPVWTRINEGLDYTSDYLYCLWGGTSPTIYKLTPGGA
jgi:hypothetical protein